MQKNAASVHNTCLDKIVCYLQRIFNRNRKLKQQVSKYTKCFKIASRYAITRTYNIRKIVQQHTEVLYGFCWKFTSLSSSEQWKNFENPFRIDKVK